MIVLDTSSGFKHEVEIIPVEEADYKKISKKRYFFNWTIEREYEVYKLRIVGSTEIIGLVSLERIASEWRVHIRLLTVSIENKGSEKQYENIVGNLIAYTAKIAVGDYGEYACVSLKPKSRIAQHYIDKYKMTSTGKMLSLEVPAILDLIKLYDLEK